MLLGVGALLTVLGIPLSLFNASLRSKRSQRIKEVFTQAWKEGFGNEPPAEAAQCVAQGASIMAFYSGAGKDAEATAKLQQCVLSYVRMFAENEDKRLLGLSILLACCVRPDGRTYPGHQWAQRVIENAIWDFCPSCLNYAMEDVPVGL